MRNIGIGDKITVRLFNVPDNKYYGDYRTATVLDVDLLHFEGKHCRPYFVKFSDTGYELWITAREVTRVHRLF